MSRPSVATYGQRLASPAGLEGFCCSPPSPSHSGVTPPVSLYCHGDWSKRKSENWCQLPLILRGIVSF